MRRRAQGRSEQGNITKRRSVIRIAALLLCVCCIAVLLSANLFLVIHGEHEHDHNGHGGSCSVCIQIAAAEGLIKQLCLSTAGAAFGFGILSWMPASFKRASSFSGFATPVQLKVRLNH